MTEAPLYEPETRPRKTQPWVIILIILALLLVCCCLLLVAGWFLGDPVLEILRDLGFEIDRYLMLQSWSQLKVVSEIALAVESAHSL